MKISFLSNCNINGPFFSKTLKKQGDYDCYFSEGYNTWIQELLVNDEIRSSNCVFIYLRADELCDLRDEREINLNKLDEYLDIIFKFKSQCNDVPIIVSSLDFLGKEFFSIDKKIDSYYLASYWVEKLYKNNIIILYLDKLYSSIGKDNFYSQKMWYYGSCPFSMKGEKILAKECNRILQAIVGNRKKCLLLDLDNTLWGGVIGEDGEDGIILGNSKEGLIYQDVQKIIKDAKNLGVILVVVSKNNEEDALKGIDCSRMILKRDDFSLILANWSEKSDNIKKVAQVLNIGLDSMVFIDDNVIEREKIIHNLPDVVVPDFPLDIIQLPNFMYSVVNDYFSIMSLTIEDKKKSELYLQEKKRNEAKNSFDNINDYLKSLDMFLKISINNKEHIKRISQLTQKTNQFNLTTKRYTEQDILSFMNCNDTFIFDGELQDKYGDYGIISVAICKIDFDTKKAKIDTFLMSCRAMGRMVENCLMEQIELFFKNLDVVEVSSEFCPTKKNKPVEFFYENMKYDVINQQEFIKKYSKNLLNNILSSSNLIKVEVHRYGE